MSRSWSGKETEGGVRYSEEGKGLRDQGIVGGGAVARVWTMGPDGWTGKGEEVGFQVKTENKG